MNKPICKREAEYIATRDELDFLVVGDKPGIKRFFRQKASKARRRFLKADLHLFKSPKNRQRLFDAYNRAEERIIEPSSLESIR